MKALKFLNSDKNIIILKADKGNYTVIMNRKEYDEKVEAMPIDSKTYQTLASDPAKKCEKKLKDLLHRYKDKIQEAIYRRIYITDGITPRFYGLPKIHKQSVPLRPIVSFIGSPTYELSKYLCRILSPLIGNTTHYLKNTNDWISVANTLKLLPDEALVSFDVVSLFTSIPTDIAVSVALERLEWDQHLRAENEQLYYLKMFQHCRLSIQRQILPSITRNSNGVSSFCNHRRFGYGENWRSRAHDLCYTT